MSGTGGWQTSGAGTPERRVPGGALGAVVKPPATPAERHIGDRLAALVDGELGHDSRERVLAHLATCDQCRGEAEEQRQLKTVFAAVAPFAPGPSAGLLARLQGLPGTGPDDGRTGPVGESRDPGRLAGHGGPGPRRGPFDARALPSAGREDVVAATAGSPGSTGFRIHEFTRPARPAPPRGRRFAFAAAGAFSLAVVALGGLPADDGAPTGRPEEPGSTVTPSVARPGGGMLSSTGGDEPLFMNAPVTLVSVRQPMRLVPGPSPSTPGVQSSLLGGSGGPGAGVTDR